MKESNPLNNDDLDAGWDVSDETDSPAMSGSISVPPMASQRTFSAHTDELDGGWDMEPEPASTDVAPRAAVVPSPAVVPAPRKLTKKERREFERQQRTHAAKKQAELKQKRKQQRQASGAQTKAQPGPATTEEPTRRTSVTLAQPAKRSKRKAKPTRVAQPVEPQSLTMPRATSAGVRHQKERPADIEDRTSAAASAASAKPPEIRQRTLIGAVLIVVLVAVAVFLLLQRK